ncbi:organic solute transporter subunit beta [Pelodytes ibericus]
MADSNIKQAIMAKVTLSAEQQKLQRAVWFFRIGDLKAWNYAILSIAFVALFLGIFLLVRNIFNNKKRKMIALYQKTANTALPDEAAGKQAVIHLEKGSQLPEDTLLKKEPQPGDIAVQWKDGQVTSLFVDVPEADV